MIIILIVMIKALQLTIGECFYPSVFHCLQGVAPVGIKLPTHAQLDKLSFIVNHDLLHNLLGYVTYVTFTIYLILRENNE